MARAPNAKLEEAYNLYIKGYKMIDIAKELDIPDGTVRRWKLTYNWGENKPSNKPSNERSIKKEVKVKQEKKDKKNNERSKSKSKVKVNTSKKKIKKEPIAGEVEEVLNNTELNDKQRLFCVLYAKCMNATKSYQKAYRCTYESAMVNGNKLLRKAKIKEQIDLLIAAEFNKEFLTRGLIQKYIDIAFSDIGDYIKFGKKTRRVWGKDVQGRDVPIMDPETGEQKEIEYNYIDLKESPILDTTLISEVSQGKDGVKFKLMDKMKAMDFLTKHCNLLNDEEKIKLDIEYKKLQNERIETEIIKMKKSIPDEDDEDEVEDDGFIQALGDRTSEVWSNEEDY